MEKQLKKLETKEGTFTSSNTNVTGININNRQSVDLNTSQTSFFNQSKQTSFENYLNVMKSDIHLLQEQINQESHILSFMSITLSGTTKKKAKEIEEGKREGIKSSLDRINQEVQNQKVLQSTYSTTSKTEIIKKMYQEVLYYDLLLKKLNEYFLISFVSLRQDESIKDSISNVSLLLATVEKMKEKLAAYEKKENDLIPINKEILQKNKEDELKEIKDLKESNYFDTKNFKKKTDESKLIECSNLNEFLMCLNQEGPLFEQIKNFTSELLINESNAWLEIINSNTKSKINQISLSIPFVDLINKLSSIKQESNKLLSEINSSNSKDNHVKDQNVNEIKELKELLSDYKKQIDLKQQEIQKIKKEFDDFKSQNIRQDDNKINSVDKYSPNQSETDKVKKLMSLLNESKLLFKQMKE